MTISKQILVQIPVTGKPLLVLQEALVTTQLESQAAPDMATPRSLSAEVAAKTTSTSVIIRPAQIMVRISIME